jgi:hypothetical protein
MKPRKLLIIFTLGYLQIARAEQDANPYLAIAGHNSFGLSPLSSSSVQDSKTPPPAITLNGLMTIFGDKRALFKVRAQSGEEKSCILSEGQRDEDIELLSVDMKKDTITVNNHGIIQKIAICKTAILPMIENKVAANGGINPAANDNSKFSSNATQTPAPEVQNANGQPAAFQSGYQVGAANSKTASSADNGATANDNQNSSAPQIDPWWVRGSKMVEQSRVQSADAVLNGTASPLPLTPLTPPGTPANLISSEQMFFDHM